MTLKKLNPEELQPGKKYLVEMELLEKDNSYSYPYYFEDKNGGVLCFPAHQPIYTHEPSIEPTAELTDDKELQMLVNVASRMHSDNANLVLLGYCNRPTKEEIAKEALDLIAACKMAIKEGER